MFISFEGHLKIHPKEILQILEKLLNEQIYLCDNIYHFERWKLT